MSLSSDINLCSLCSRQTAGEDTKDIKVVENSYECVLCFGILDPLFIDEVCAKVQSELDNLPYDATSFILALNLPCSQTIREIILRKSRPDFHGILVSVPFKIRNINAYLAKLSNASGKRPTLCSDLHLTITFENDEFNEYDKDFLTEQFPKDFQQGKKRRYHEQRNESTEVSKYQIEQVAGRITDKMASTYKLCSPTHPCKFSLAFEREPIFIAGRYCKFSRSLPQSPWSEDKDGPKEQGNSVSEKVCDILKAEFGASESRFVASGREDIDVRMLGDGRPFSVELRNCRITKPVQGTDYLETLERIANKINAQKDIRVKYLSRVSRAESDTLSVGQDEKRKSYTAYCYSTLPLSPESISRALSAIPVEIIQKTPVRVLKRRSLLDRPRNIYKLELLRIDEHHFMVRMDTQAGTYIKEFVHGDFGRTRPSLADLLGVDHGEVDILELDVEAVDQVWPPKHDIPVSFK